MTGKANRLLLAWALLVFGICFALYTILFFLPPGRGMQAPTTGDEPHYLVMTQSLLEDGDLTLENNYRSECYREAGYYPLRLDNPHLVKGRGRLVSSHNVMLSLLILPGFALAGWRGAGITMILLVSLSGLMVFLTIRRFTSQGASAAVTLFFFLTYPLLLYSRLIYPEVVALFLLSVAVHSCVRLRESGKMLDLAVAGLCGGILPLLHVKFTVITAFLGLWVVLEYRKALRRTAPFFIPVAVLIAGLLAWTAYLYGPNIVSGLSVLAKGSYRPGTSYQGILGLYLDRTLGLLPYAPLYIALFMGMPLPSKSEDWRKWWIALPALVAAYSLVAGSFEHWHGGAAPAPRYLVPLLPLFILCSSLVFVKVRKPWLAAGLAALAAFQVVLTVCARICPASVCIAHGARNELYIFIFGDNQVSRTLERLFPIFHPVTYRTAVMAAIWAAFLAALILFRRRYLATVPGELLDSVGSPLTGDG